MRLNFVIFYGALYKIIYVLYPSSFTKKGNIITITKLHEKITTLAKIILTVWSKLWVCGNFKINTKMLNILGYLTCFS